MRIIARASVRRVLKLQLEAVALEHGQHLDRLSDNLRADAVSGQDCDFHLEIGEG